MDEQWREPMGIDVFSPVWQFSEIHQVRVEAAPERVYRALAALTPAEVPLVGVLMALRSLNPVTIARALRAGAGESLPILAAMRRRGFVLLSEKRGRELVLGIVGRFWHLSGGLPPGGGVADAAAFQAFSDPSYARAVVDFRIEAEPDGGSRLSTETRICAPSSGARWRFALYWAVIHPGSALIRGLWLRAVKRRAEAWHE